MQLYLQNVKLPKMKIISFKLLPFILFVAQIYSFAASPTLSRAEKINSLLDVATIKALTEIHVPIIKTSELKKIIDDTNLVLIDIRQQNEQDTSMLPHALSTKQFAEKFRHGIPKEKRLVVYCTIGYRSGKYAETLAKQGIKSENLEGGILAWTFVDGPLEKINAQGEKIATHTVHTYSKEWNLVHPNYKGVW